MIPVLSDALSCYSAKPTSPKDSSTASKEQRPPFKGRGIFTNADVYFIKHFKKHIKCDRFHLFNPFQKYQPRKEHTGVFRDETPKRPRYENDTKKPR